MKKLFLLIFLFFSFNSLVYAEEVYLTVSFVSVGYETCMPAVGTTVTRSYLKQSKLCGGDLETRRGVPLYKIGGRTITSFFVAKACPDGYERQPDGSCKPKNKCSDKKGKDYGRVSFPEGTKDVRSICRNSCSLNNIMFFPDANPPFGTFKYTGEACTGGDGSGSGGDGSGSGGSGSGGDGSGSGGDGGSTGGGSGSGGGDGGSTGGGSGSGGGDGGSTGGGSGSGGGNDKDGLTKGDIREVLNEVFGKKGDVNPTHGEGFKSDNAINGLSVIKGEVKNLEEKLKEQIKKSPLKMGSMHFTNGSYDSTSFNLSRWGVDVDFNLFRSLGSSNVDLIRTVILFVAALIAGFILLSSGRTKG